MKRLTVSKSSALLAVLSSSVMVATASSAVAMPAASIAAPSIASSLQRVADEHRVYPGSEDSAAQKARAERNAPNRFCEKQQQYCE